MKLAAPQLVNSKVCCHLEQEGAGVIKGFRGVQPVQPQERLLGDLGGVFLAVKRACKVAFQRCPVGRNQARQKSILVARQTCDAVFSLRVWRRQGGGT